MTDLDYFMIPKDIVPEVASCYQTQQTSDPSTNLFPGTSQAGATFEGGTKRSGRKPAYHLVMIEPMEAVARTREEGDRKYAPGNWMKGSKEFFVDCLGHAIEHLVLCVWDEEESLWTHLGHAATNIGFILWALAQGKVSRRDFQRAAVVAQDEKMEILKAQEAKMRGTDGTGRCQGAGPSPDPGFDAFDEVFERALTDHDRVLLWLFRISVASGLETEWVERDKRLSTELSPGS